MTQTPSRSRRTRLGLAAPLLLAAMHACGEPAPPDAPDSSGSPGSSDSLRQAAFQPCSAAPAPTALCAGASCPIVGDVLLTCPQAPSQLAAVPGDAAQDYLLLTFSESVSSTSLRRQLVRLGPSAVLGSFTDPVPASSRAVQLVRSRTGAPALLSTETTGLTVRTLSGSAFQTELVPNTDKLGDPLAVAALSTGGTAALLLDPAASPSTFSAGAAAALVQQGTGGWSVARGFLAGTGFALAGDSLGRAHALARTPDSTGSSSAVLRHRIGGTEPVHSLGTPVGWSESGSSTLAVPGGTSPPIPVLSDASGGKVALYGSLSLPSFSPIATLGQRADACTGDTTQCSACTSTTCTASGESVDSHAMATAPDGTVWVAYAKSNLDYTYGFTTKVTDFLFWKSCSCIESVRTDDRRRTTVLVLERLRLTAGAPVHEVRFQAALPEATGASRAALTTLKLSAQGSLLQLTYQPRESDKQVRRLLFDLGKL